MLANKKFAKLVQKENEGGFQGKGWPQGVIKRQQAKDYENAL